MPVMEEPDSGVKVRRVAAERLFQLASVSAQPVALAQKLVVEAFRLFLAPERIEGTDVESFGLAAPFEFNENVNLFFEEVIFLVGERGLVPAQRAQRLVEILLLDQMIDELFDYLERGRVRGDQAAEEIGALIFLQPMAARHFDQLAQYRSAFLPWGGGDHSLPRGGLIGKPRASTVEVGEPFKRRQVILLKLDVAPHLRARLLLVAQLLVKLAQLQLDLGILRIKLSDFGQSRAGFAGRIRNDRLSAEKFRASEQGGFYPLGALFSRRLCGRGFDRAMRRDDRQTQNRNDHRRRNSFSDWRLFVNHLVPLLCCRNQL